MADIGLVGLGVMGSNLALNMAEKGYTVAVYNRTTARTDAFIASAGSLASRLVPCRTLAELAAAVRPPRPIIMLVKAGEPVDEQSEALLAVFCRAATSSSTPATPISATRGAGSPSCRARHHLHRHGRLRRRGGRAPWSLDHGRRHAGVLAQRVEKILDDISAKFNGEPCAALVGPDGAGHFVKTIHNGIEYADMQMIAEIYGIMRDGLGMSPARDGADLRALERRSAQILSDRDHRHGAWRRPIRRPASRWSRSSSTRAGQKGTGRWATIEAQDLGVPATVIEAAVAARALSAQRQERLAGEALFGAAPRKLDGALGDAAVAEKLLEQALLAGKIGAYAQGFAVLAKASEAWGWNLPLGTIAKIWRAGCIIRSVFLDIDRRRPMPRPARSAT